MNHLVIAHLNAERNEALRSAALHREQAKKISGVALENERAAVSKEAFAEKCAEAIAALGGEVQEATPAAAPSSAA
jgi:hypothetical protein